MDNYNKPVPRMHQQHHYQPHQEHNRRQMEDEMNRFEAELAGGFQTINRQLDSMTGGGGSRQGPSSMFIPHSLRQHMPTGKGGQHQSYSHHQAPPTSYHGGPHLHQPPHLNHHAAPSPQQPQFVNAQAGIIAAQGSATVGYTVTPMGLPPTASQSTAIPSSSQTASKKTKGEPTSNSKKKKNKKNLRTAGGQTWEDQTLTDWDTNDFRIFCGDLGNDVTEDVLTRAFNKYPSFQKVKVVRDKKTNKTKGYGFVSFKDPQDFIRAMRDMNGKYVGSRPIKLRKSTWRDRNVESVKKKKKERSKLGLL